MQDEILKYAKAMILEANKGAGVTKGVDVDDFRAVMTKAGVFQ